MRLVQLRKKEVVWQSASFSNNRSKISSKTQNGMWMGQAEDLYMIIMFLFFESIPSEKGDFGQ